MSKSNYSSEEPIKNKYFVWYHNIILRSKCKQRIKGNGIYFENHHIIPKCMKGSNDKNNLVLLTGREHFICHHLLTKFYPSDKKLQYALWAMCTVNKNNSKSYKVTSRIYEKTKSLIAKDVKARMSKKLTIENRENISKGKIGYTRTPESIELWKKSRDGYKHSNTTKLKFKEAKQVRIIIHGKFFKSIESAGISYGVSFYIIKTWLKNNKPLCYFIDSEFKNRKSIIFHGKFFNSIKECSKYIGLSTYIVKQTISQNYPLCYCMNTKPQIKNKKSLSRFKKVILFGKLYNTMKEAVTDLRLSYYKINILIENKYPLCYFVK